MAGPTGSPQNIRVRPTGSGELHVAWSVSVYKTLIK